MSFMGDFLLLDAPVSENSRVVILSKSARVVPNSER
jgi:hypothetical protein